MCATNSSHNLAQSSAPIAHTLDVLTTTSQMCATNYDTLYGTTLETRCISATEVVENGAVDRIWEIVMCIETLSPWRIDTYTFAAGHNVYLLLRGPTVTGQNNHTA